MVRLILLTVILSLFFACSSSADKKEESIKDDWVIPAQYKNIPIEQIKSQIEITEYKTMKGAGTTAATEAHAQTGEPSRSEDSKSLVAGGAAVPDESPKNKADREALAEYTNKLISLEGVVNTVGTQKNSPLDIKETLPGKYEIWFCADKNQKRKPCRYRAYLLYEAPEGKGDTLFTHDNVIRFWGVVLEEQIGILKLPNGRTYKRYPKIRVLDLEIIK